jgi:alpha-1,2-mannosyltransferase
LRERLTFAALWALVLFYLAASPIAAARDADFTHLWAAGAAWFEGGAYNPLLQKEVLWAAVEEPLWADRNDALGSFFYPPTALLMYVPLGWLPVHRAALVMAVLNAVLGVGAGLLISLLSPRGKAAGVALVLLYPSFFFAYVLGQNGALTLVLLLGALLASKRGRPWLAGLLLGLTAWKPSWFFAVSWLWILMPGRFKVLGGMAAGALGLVLASLPLGGWPEFLELAPRIAALSEQGDYPAHLQFNLQGLSLRFGTAWPGWLAAVAVVGVTLWKGWNKGPGALPAALVAATLANPHMHHYDALPALLAVAVLGRWWVVLLFHAAFVLSEGLGLSAVVPLPTLAMLGVWALSLFDVLEPRPGSSGPTAPQPSSPTAPGLAG